MTIKEELVIDIPEIEEDFPGQQREYYRQEIKRGLIGFIHRVIDKRTHSMMEERALRFEIAMQLLESFRQRTVSDLLSEDLSRRGED